MRTTVWSPSATARCCDSIVDSIPRATHHISATYPSASLRLPGAPEVGGKRSVDKALPVRQEHTCSEARRECAAPGFLPPDSLAATHGNSCTRVLGKPGTWLSREGTEENRQREVARQSVALCSCSKAWGAGVCSVVMPCGGSVL